MGYSRLSRKFFRIIMEKNNMYEFWQISCTKEIESNARYIQFNIKNFIRSGEKKLLLQLVDVSKSLLYDKMSAQQQFL